MLVACRLAGLSALEAQYAGINAPAKPHATTVTGLARLSAFSSRSRTRAVTSVTMKAISAAATTTSALKSITLVKHHTRGIASSEWT